MNLIELTTTYLREGCIMQLATAVDGQPWVCSLYYITDEALNIYWLSLASRRHSQHISKHSKVAVTVPIKLSEPVVGVQAEGKAEIIEDASLIKKIMKRYVEKYGAGKKFYENFINGKNKHLMYRLTPKSIVLFDEFNFPHDGRRIVEMLP